MPLGFGVSSDVQEGWPLLYKACYILFSPWNRFVARLLFRRLPRFRLLPPSYFMQPRLVFLMHCFLIVQPPARRSLPAPHTNNKGKLPRQALEAVCLQLPLQSISHSSSECPQGQAGPVTGWMSLWVAIRWREESPDVYRQWGYVKWKRPVCVVVSSSPQGLISPFWGLSSFCFH